MSEPPVIQQAREAAATAARPYGPSRAGQLNWVCGELASAIAHKDFPTDCRDSLTALLSERGTDAYLTLAARNEFRTHNMAPVRNPLWSDRVRRRCLVLIGTAAGVAVELPLHPPARPLHTPITLEQQRVLRDFVLHPPHHHRTITRWRWQRTAALIGCALDTGSPESTLLTLHATHADLEQKTLVLPDGAYRLSPETTQALSRWLTSRARLLDGAPRPTPALWVSLGASFRGKADALVLRPTGMPLTVKGSHLGYQDAVYHLNALHAGRPGWEPLPTRFEQLRRAVEAQPMTVAQTHEVTEVTAEATFFAS
ncbi:hypothetical protein ACH4TC_18465 [Streptomyces spororaveus]|uniref:hypothetical protein n=1 Tax=Streptomyces spororaveus TaxID=284039 RepID=UPI0037872B9F